MKTITQRWMVSYMIAVIFMASIFGLTQVCKVQAEEAAVIVDDLDASQEATSESEASKVSDDTSKEEKKSGKEEKSTTSKKKTKAEKKASKITIKEFDDKEYTGNPVKLTRKNCTISGSKGEVTFTYYKLPEDPEEDRTKLKKAPVNAGDYMVKAVLSADDDYNSAEDEYRFSISSVSNSWSKEPQIDDYDFGGTPNPQAEAEYGDVVFTYSSSKDGEFTENKPDAPGVWYLKASVAKTDNYDGLEAIISFTVNAVKLENEWTKEPAIEGWTYGAKENDPVGEALHGEVIFSYSREKDGTYEKEVKRPLNAGTWYLKAEVEEDEDYKGITEYIEFTVEKAIPDCEAPTEIFKAEYGQTLADITLPDGFAWADSTQSVGGVGSKIFDAVFIPEDTTNYQTVGNISITVLVSQGKNQWLNEANPVTVEGWSYGEKAKQPSAPSKFGEAIFTYSNKKEGPYTSTVPTAPGVWYVKASVPESADYTGLESDPVSFEISKAIPSYEVPGPYTAVYGQTLAELSLPEGFTWEDSAQSVGDVGTNTFKAVYTPKEADLKHYQIVSGIEITVNVIQAENEWLNEDQVYLKGWVYGSNPNVPDAPAKFGNDKVVFTYSDKKDGKYSEKVPTNAGTWYIKAAIPETKNYTGLESKANSFTITPKDGTKLSIPTIDKDTNLDKLAIKDGDYTLKKGTDYDITKKQSGDTVTVTIKFKGNYSGTVTKKYTVSSSTKSSSGTTAAKNSNSKKTGDDTPLALYGTVLVLAGALMILLAVLKMHKRKG